MKKYYAVIAAFGAIAIGTIIILLAGCATKPPTQFEQRMFNIETNIIPVLVVRTNVVIVTNLVGVTEFQTNIVTTVKTNESYVYKPGAGAQEIAQTGGAIGNFFGAGGVVSTGIMGLFSIWGYLRSKKNYVTAANLAQTVETVREFVKALPNGAAYDTALVQFMQTHQAESGVLNQVLALLQREVSNPDAKIAADHILKLLNSLQGLTSPVPQHKV